MSTGRNGSRIGCLNRPNIFNNSIDCEVQTDRFGAKATWSVSLFRPLLAYLHSNKSFIVDKQAEEEITLLFCDCPDSVAFLKGNSHASPWQRSQKVYVSLYARSIVSSAWRYWAPSPVILWIMNAHWKQIMNSDVEVYSRNES